MANKEQFERLKHEVQGWNAWRQEHPSIEIDLREADLEQAQLVDTTLEHTNLEGCRIYGISAWNLKVVTETQKKDARQATARKKG
jgi:hypothetical protein